MNVLTDVVVPMLTGSLCVVVGIIAAAIAQRIMK